MTTRNDMRKMDDHEFSIFLAAQSFRGRSVQEIQDIVDEVLERSDRRLVIVEDTLKRLENKINKLEDRINTL